MEPGPAPRLNRRRRDLAIGVSVGLLMTFAATGYMLSNRSRPIQLAISPSTDGATTPVRLTVNPAWSEVSLDDKPIEPVAENGQFQISLPTDQGDLHWLSVTAEGYHPVRRPLSVFGGIDDITIELVRKPIEVAIRSEPSDAQVWIDNEFKGNTPLAITMLPWEASTLSLKREGFQPVSRPIKPPAKGNRLDLDFALERAGLFVRVETQPPGAIVAIDGRAAGATPMDVPLTPEYRGREIEITTTLAGYEPASHRLRLPDESDGQPIVARLAMIRPQSELVVNTKPQGAEVFVGGKLIGTSPVTTTFGSEFAGQRINIEGRIPGSYSGRTSILVPPGGQTRDITLEMEMTGQRVVFVILSPTGAGSDHVLLTDHLIEQIHRLEERQQFAVLACTIEGLVAWPAEGQTAPATSDNKIRAYDLVRGIRPSARGAVTQAMQAALRAEPNTIWLFTGPKLVTDDLIALGEGDSPNAPTINAVQIAPRNKPKWLENFVHARGGSLTIIESAPRRVLARDGNTVD